MIVVCVSLPLCFQRRLIASFPSSQENDTEWKTFIFWNILQHPGVRFSSSVGKGQLKKVGFVILKLYKNLLTKINCSGSIPFDIKDTLNRLLFLLDPFHRRGRVLDRKFCLSVCVSVCLSVRLSVITFSFSDYWIIWWFTACKPYIFWKHITLVTSTALFWPSTTKYQPVPQYTDPVPPSNNRDK